jgi:uncharacterized protein (DUF697 family)
LESFEGSFFQRGWIMELAGATQKAIEEALKDRGQINILIAGRTGVGKSTLINEVFQGKLAETGQGRPVTNCTREITKEGIPLAIWDTRGLEMAAYKETIAELERLIKSRLMEIDPKRHLHVAWLCVHEDSRRVEDAEIELHRTLARYMPVLGVITKARSDNGFKAEVQRLLPETRNIVRVRALPEELDEGQQLLPMGLTELVELTAEAIPESIRRAFAAAQKASVRQKKNEARKVVITTAATAATTAATPIPFADAVVLIPLQIGMLAKISSTFGLSLSSSFLSTIVVAAAGTTGATVAGRAIVSNLMKLIPGAGSLIGGTISAATAGVLTITLGELYIATLATLYSESGGREPQSDKVVQEFKKRLGDKNAPSGR